MQVRVRVGIVGDLEQRHEDVVENLTEVGDDLVRFEDITRKERKREREI